MHFITRTEMYIGEISKNSIISFINGYEIETEYKCNLTDNISKLLSSKYKLDKKAMGWSGQIQEYANKNQLDWITSFRKIVLVLFYSIENINSHSECMGILKPTIENWNKSVEEFPFWIKENYGIESVKNKLIELETHCLTEIQSDKLKTIKWWLKI